MYIAASYHCMLFQGKLNLVSGPILAGFGQNLVHKFFSWLLPVLGNIKPSFGSDFGTFGQTLGPKIFFR